MTSIESRRYLANFLPGIPSTIIIGANGRVVPTFDKDEAQLEEAAKCTVFVIIDHPSKGTKTGSRYYGTAFFISPKLLLTAGHNIVSSDGPLEHVRITYPGLPYIN